MLVKFETDVGAISWVESGVKVIWPAAVDDRINMRNWRLIVTPPMVNADASRMNCSSRPGIGYCSFSNGRRVSRTVFPDMAVSIEAGCSALRVLISMFSRRVAMMTATGNRNSRQAGAKVRFLTSATRLALPSSIAMTVKGRPGSAAPSPMSNERWKPK